MISAWEEPSSYRPCRGTKLGVFLGLEAVHDFRRISVILANVYASKVFADTVGPPTSRQIQISHLLNQLVYTQPDAYDLARATIFHALSSPQLRARSQFSGPVRPQQRVCASAFVIDTLNSCVTPTILQVLPRGRLRAMMQAKATQ